MNWYETNNKTDVCFICQQVNQFSEDIHFKTPEKEIEIRENLLQDTNREENKKCIKLWLCGNILGTISGIIMLIICL